MRGPHREPGLPAAFHADPGGSSTLPTLLLLTILLLGQRYAELDEYQRLDAGLNPAQHIHAEFFQVMLPMKKSIL